MIERNIRETDGSFIDSESSIKSKDVINISHEAEIKSNALVLAFSEMYSNEMFMMEHPDYKKRVDLEKEKLRQLIKMQQSIELSHDMVLQAIERDIENESLHRSLFDFQDRLLDIQIKMDEAVKRLNILTKSYKMLYQMKEWKKKTNEFLTKIQIKTKGLGKQGKNTLLQLKRRMDKDGLIEKPKS